MKLRYIIALFLLQNTVVSFAQNTDETVLKEQIKKELKEELQKEKTTGILSRLTFCGDTRLRIEGDWNQFKDAKQIADDRTWARYQVRFQLKVDILKNLSITTRLRSGHAQYTNVSFGDHNIDIAPLYLDKVFAEFKYEKYYATFGRNSTIFKNQKGCFWDTPVSVDGATAGMVFKPSKTSSLKTTAVYATLDSNNGNTRNDARLYGAQTEFDIQLDMVSKLNFTLASVNANNLSNKIFYRQVDAGAVFYDGDLAPDYNIIVATGSYYYKKFNVVVDYYQNLKNYSGVTVKDPKLKTSATIPDFLKDQKTGMVATIGYGSLDDKNDWKVQYGYSYIEKYAAMDYFANWDQARWNSTNIKGHEINAGYAFSKNLNFVCRAFFMEDVIGYSKTDVGYTEGPTRSGNRIRFDLNFKF